jgi:hypothetical protein
MMDDGVRAMDILRNNSKGLSRKFFRSVAYRVRIKRSHDEK